MNSSMKPRFFKAQKLQMLAFLLMPSCEPLSLGQAYLIVNRWYSGGSKVAISKNQYRLNIFSENCVYCNRMKKVKQIFVFFFAAMVFLTTSGFAFHTIQCQITGDTYQSVIDKKCCCELSAQRKKCCNEESLVVKVDSQVDLKGFNFHLNPLFLAAFYTQYIELYLPAEYEVKYLSYFKHSPPLAEQEIIILVQSFLL